MEKQNLVPFCYKDVIKVLTDGNHVYDAITMVRLDGASFADGLLAVLRQPEKYHVQCAKMEKYGYKLVGNIYIRK